LNCFATSAHDVFDGYLYFCDDESEHRAFHVHDGFGLKLLMHSGVEVGIITTSTTSIITRRMEGLGIQHLYLGHLNKSNAYTDLLNKLNLSDEQVAYIGDDLPDLSLIKRVGLGIAVADAVPMVREQADWVTTKNGGKGAVREACELIMQAQNSLEKAFNQYQESQ